MGMTVKLEGFDELDKIVTSLPDKMKKRVLRKSARAGSAVVAKRAKQKVSTVSGKTKKSIKVKTYKPGIGHATAVVFAGDKDAYYAHMIEFGTQRHSLGAGSNISSGKQTGRIHPGAKPAPFLRPAFEETTTEQINAVGKALLVGMLKEIQKA